MHGAGDVATQHLKAYLNNPLTRVIAISSKREESARKLANSYDLEDVEIYTDYGKMLENDSIDIVSICTPQQFHAKEVIAAAEAHKHMLIEKPVALNVQELHAMSQAVTRSGVKTVVGFVLRWNSVISTLKNFMSQGFLGKIFYVETDYQSHAWEPVKARWEWVRSKETGISPFLVAGVHAIDMARWLADTKQGGTADITEVVSYSGGYRKGQLLPPFEHDVVRYTGRHRIEGTLVPPLEYDGLEVMIMKLGNGTLAKVSTNFDAIMPYDFVWGVYGDKGTCKGNRLWSTEFADQEDWITMPGTMPNSASVGTHPFQGEIDHLISSIQHDKESHANLQNSVNTHEAALAAMISRKEGNVPVKLPLT
ncbi:MAG: Gfo/Idh/MocA family oxidoreductase [Thaumarchaeota archaeon]|nr:Gfo/Idh/MocA family oxidoreductase [Nitrososphaerota archaeon]